MAAKSQQRPAQRTAAERHGSLSRPENSTDEFQRLLRANTVDTARSPGRRRRRSPVLGKLAFTLAIASIAVDASAFAVFMGGEMEFASGICFVVVLLTLVTALIGFIAAVGGLGRWYGVFAVLIAFAANPVILAIVLAFVAPDVASTLGTTTP